MSKKSRDKAKELEVAENRQHWQGGPEVFENICHCYFFDRDAIHEQETLDGFVTILGNIADYWYVQTMHHERQGNFLLDIVRHLIVNWRTKSSITLPSGPTDWIGVKDWVVSVRKLIGQKPRKKLGNTASLIYEKLLTLPEHRGMKLSEIVDWLWKEHEINLSETVVYKNHITQLKPWGLQHDHGIGYSINQE